MTWLATLATKLLMAIFEKLGESIAEVVRQKIAENLLRKEVNERIEEIRSEEDPKIRARRMRDLINSF